MDIIDLLDEAIREKMPVERRKYGTVGPSPFLHRAKSLYDGIKGSGGIQRRGRVYRALHTAANAADAQHFQETRKLRKDPEFAAVHHAAKEGDHVAAAAEDDIREERGGIRGSEVQHHADRAHAGTNRYRQARSRGFQRNPDSDVRGHHEEMVRNFVNSQHRGSTRAKRKTRAAVEQTTDSGRRNPIYSGKSFQNNVKSSPFASRQHLSALGKAMSAYNSGHGAELIGSGRKKVVGEVGEKKLKKKIRKYAAAQRDSVRATGDYNYSATVGEHEHYPAPLGASVRTERREHPGLHHAEEARARRDEAQSEVMKKVTDGQRRRVEKGHGNRQGQAQAARAVGRAVSGEGSRHRRNQQRRNRPAE